MQIRGNSPQKRSATFCSRVLAAREQGTRIARSSLRPWDWMSLALAHNLLDKPPPLPARLTCRVAVCQLPARLTCRVAVCHKSKECSSHLQILRYLLLLGRLQYSSEAAVGLWVVDHHNFSGFLVSEGFDRARRVLPPTRFIQPITAPVF